MDDEVLGMILQSASAAVTHAQDVRLAHRKRTTKGSRQREVDIAIALTRLKRVMQPIRSNLVKLSRGNQAEQRVKLAEASQAIQRERRKLWKMKARRRKHAGRRRR